MKLAGGVMRAVARNQQDQAVVVENNQSSRTLSLGQASGFDLIFDSKRSPDSSPDIRPTCAEQLALTLVTFKEIANQVSFCGSLKPDGARGAI
jgi:hypothetical protein